MKLLSVTESKSKGKKLTALFDVDGRTKRVSFGAKGMKDFIQYSAEDRVLAEERKRLYLLRHAHRESWNDPLSPGALSRWILWNKPSLDSSIADYKRRFGL